MTRLAVLFLLLCLPVRSWGVATYEADERATTGATNANLISFNFTCTNAQTVLYVAAHIRETTTAPTAVTNITYGTTLLTFSDFTEVDTHTTPASGARQVTVSVWRAVPGADCDGLPHTLAVTINAVRAWGMGAVTVTGVDLTAPNDGTVTADTSAGPLADPTVGPIPSAAGDLVLAWYARVNIEGVSVLSGETIQYEPVTTHALGSDNVRAVLTTEPGAASVTSGVDTGTNAKHWVAIGLNVNAAPLTTTCSHYASPTGTGTACSDASPCSVAQFFNTPALPGQSLCLKDGTYTGANSMVNPTDDNLSGTSGNPITVRAENDGGAILDGQFARRPVELVNNDYFVLEGFDAHSGNNSTISTATTTDNVTIRRVIAWDADPTIGDNLWNIRGGVNNLVEDCGGFGQARKIFGSAQSTSSGSVVWRRCWGRWEQATPVTGPKETLTITYNNWNSIFENMLLTWDQGAATGISQVEATGYCCRLLSGSDPGVLNNSVLGSIFYILNGESYQPGRLVQNATDTGNNFSNLTYNHNVFYVEPGAHATVKTFRGDGTTLSPANLVLSNSVGISTAGRDTIDLTDWTVTNFMEGATISDATGGASLFTAVPGICTRYVNGTLTSAPLWPWPMNDRILQARSRAGRSAIDVTATITAQFGAIPPACTSVSATPRRPSGLQYRLLQLLTLWRFS